MIFISTSGGTSFIVIASALGGSLLRVMMPGQMDLWTALEECLTEVEVPWSILAMPDIPCPALPDAPDAARFPLVMRTAVYECESNVWGATSSL